jgi:hypothetical protein
MGVYFDAQQREREKSGQVIYDPATNQFMRYEPAQGLMVGSINGNRQGRYVPISAPGFGQTTYTPPTVDFNNLPKHSNSQSGVPVQPYVRPNAPPQNIGSGYRPQFDPSFIQQMLAQRFGNQQPNAGIPTAVQPTLTPGAQQSYGGFQGQGGLAGLRSIANPAPAAPAGGIQNAPL